MEWHDNGYPHWHLLIEVDKPGRAGMTGQDLLHKLWSHGDSNHRIHEYYFKTEARFKNFTGYFSKSGYLHKDKQHQVTLPAWANAPEWAGIKINRFSSKRISNKQVEEKPEPAGEPMKRPRRIMTYAAKHDRCGNEVDIWEVDVEQHGDEKNFSRSYIGKYRVPYETVINALDGQFIEGYGYSFEAQHRLCLSPSESLGKHASGGPRAAQKFPPGPHHRPD